MRNSSFTLLILIAAAATWQSCDSTINIESPNEKYFVKYIGTQGHQRGVDIALDANEDIYLLGSSSATAEGSNRVYVARATKQGEVIWTRILPENGDEDARDIEINSDGNIVIIADRDTGTERDFVVYLLSSQDGGFIGTPRIGGTPGIDDYATSITETSDGYIVTSYAQKGSYKEANVRRYNKDLLEFGPSWKTTFDFQTTVVGGGFDLVPVKVLQADANTFYTFCYTNAAGIDNISDYNFFVFVTGQQNNLINSFTVPGRDPNNNEVLASVKQVPVQSGAGFVLVGYESAIGSSQQNLYAVRLVQGLSFVLPGNPDTFIQTKQTGLTSDLSVILPPRASVYPSNSSGFLVLGAQTNLGSEDIFLTKVDNNLNNAWPAPRTFGGIGQDLPGAVVETSDGRILLCGTMVLGDVNGQKKIALLKLSPNGMFGE